MAKTKLYNPDKVNSLEMQFGRIAKSVKKRYEKKKTKQHKSKI